MQRNVKNMVLVKIRRYLQTLKSGLHMLPHRLLRVCRHTGCPTNGCCCCVPAKTTTATTTATTCTTTTTTMFMSTGVVCTKYPPPKNIQGYFWHKNLCSDIHVMRCTILISIMCMFVASPHLSYPTYLLSHLLIYI